MVLAALAGLVLAIMFFLIMLASAILGHADRKFRRQRGSASS